MEKLYDIKVLWQEKKFWIIGGVVVFIIILIGIFCYYHFSINKNQKLDLEREDFLVENTKEETDESKENDCVVTVDVKGKVNQPGLYQLSCDSRVQDALLLAGNITEDADTSVLNLSKKVFDEMVVIVYSYDETQNFIEIKKQEVEKMEQCPNYTQVQNDACIEPQQVEESNSHLSLENSEDNQPLESQSGDQQTTLISINTATKEEFMTLNGLGESKAQKIIDYRLEHGNFQSLEELKNVKGIGDSTFEKIKPYITL